MTEFRLPRRQLLSQYNFKPTYVKQMKGAIASKWDILRVPNEDWTKKIKSGVPHPNHYPTKIHLEGSGLSAPLGIPVI